jgi:hypothetical protein
MKIAIDDKCKLEFDNLKFNKAYRYLIFTINQEKIVRLLAFSLFSRRGKGIKHGMISSLSCLLLKAGMLYSTLNIKQATASTPVNYSSAFGYLIQQKSS